MVLLLVKVGITLTVVPLQWKLYSDTFTVVPLQGTFAGYLSSAGLSFILSAVLSDPLLKDPGPVLLDSEAVFHCDVTNVFSVNLIRIQWKIGNTVMKTETFKFFGFSQNISSVLYLEIKDDHRFLSCKAELLTKDGSVWSSKIAGVLLEVHCK